MGRKTSRFLTWLFSCCKKPSKRKNSTSEEPLYTKNEEHGLEKEKCTRSESEKFMLDEENIDQETKPCDRYELDVYKKINRSCKLKSKKVSVSIQEAKTFQNTSYSLLDKFDEKIDKLIAKLDNKMQRLQQTYMPVNVRKLNSPEMTVSQRIRKLGEKMPLATNVDTASRNYLVERQYKKDNEDNGKQIDEGNEKQNEEETTEEIETENEEETTEETETENEEEDSEEIETENEEEDSEEIETEYEEEDSEETETENVQENIEWNEIDNEEENEDETKGIVFEEALVFLQEFLDENKKSYLNGFHQKIFQGGFGCVFRALDIKKHEYVIFKVVKNIKVNRKEVYLHSKILNDSSAGDKNIIHLLEVYTSDSHQSMILKFENFPETLCDDMMRKRDWGLIYTANDMKHILKQLLHGLIVLNNYGFAHGDLKTSNIVIRMGAGGMPDVKLIDLGGSNVVKDGRYNHFYTTITVVAPESILCLHNDFRVDIWALGVVATEMILKRRLFRGNDTATVLHEQIKLNGYFESATFSPNYIRKSSYFSHYFDEENGQIMLKKAYESFPYKNIADACKLVHGIWNNKDHDDFVQVLTMMLQFENTVRSSAQELLEHPFLQTTSDI